MRSIVGISLIDFTIANGPSDKITKGLRMPSIIESYHEGFVYEFQFSEITFPELFSLVIRMLLNSLIFLELITIARVEFFLKIGIHIQILHGTILFLKAFEDRSQFCLLGL